MEDVMLHIKIHHSLLQEHLRWDVDATLAPGICHRLAALNGAGKTTFLEELKLHWTSLFPTLRLGFCDQAALAPFQELTVEAVMEILWDVVPQRRQAPDWRKLSWWSELEIQWSRKISELSGGENQWVKILMMRSLQSDIWLLDEPFQSLDQKRQQQLWQILQEWVSAGRYLVLVHHGDVAISPRQDWSLRSTAKGLQWERVP